MYTPLNSCRKEISSTYREGWIEGRSDTPLLFVRVLTLNVELTGIGNWHANGRGKSRWTMERYLFGTIQGYYYIYHEIYYDARGYICSELQGTDGRTEGRDIVTARSFISRYVESIRYLHPLRSARKRKARVTRERERKAVQTMKTVARRGKRCCTFTTYYKIIIVAVFATTTVVILPRS